MGDCPDDGVLPPSTTADYARVFDYAPSPSALLNPELVIVDVNRAYCAATGRLREQLVGQRIVDVFPDDPRDPASSGSAALEASLLRVLETARADVQAPQRYDVTDASGGFVQRHWSVVNVPVLDEHGQVVLVLHRPEEITAYVSSSGAAAAGDTGGGRQQDVFVRAQELQTAWQAEAAARTGLAAVSDVALRLAQAQTVPDLTAVVIEHGLAALGADGGAVAVRDRQHLDLSITSSLGQRARLDYGRLPVDGPLPSSVTVAKDVEIVLPDRAACVSFAPEMEQVITATECQAWVSLPLRDHGGAVLGALVVGWAQPREFPPAQLQVLRVLAAQCGYGLDRIQARQVEQDLAHRTRRMSETLQRSMLTAPFQPDHLELVVRYRPAARDAQVGGDWFDAFMIRGALTVVVGDVAGHDRNAAAAMGQLRNLLRGIAFSIDEPPAAVVATLDAAMTQLGLGEMATLVFGKIEQTEQHGSGQRTFRWVNAGHPPPLLIEPGGAVRLLDTSPDTLLGTRMAELPVRADHTHLLGPGSTLLLYTDGLIERRSADLDQGLDWLLTAVTELADTGLDALCDTLLAMVGNNLDDDVVLLALRAHPEDQPRPPEAGPSIEAPQQP